VLGGCVRGTVIKKDVRVVGSPRAWDGTANRSGPTWEAGGAVLPCGPQLGCVELRASSEAVERRRLDGVSRARSAPKTRIALRGTELVDRIEPSMVAAASHA
jgi:hypothetical protein